MRRRLAEDAEIVRRADDAFPEMVLPDAVDQYARHNRRLFGIEHLLGQLQPAAAALGWRRRGAAEDLEEPARHDLAELLRVAADEHRFIDAAAVDGRQAALGGDQRGFAL